MPPRQKSTKAKREPKVWTRYRARIITGIPGDNGWTGTTHRRRADAIKEGIDHALKAGIVEVIEVPMKRRLNVDYVEA